MALRTPRLTDATGAPLNVSITEARPLLGEGEVLAPGQTVVAAYDGPGVAPSRVVCFTVSAFAYASRDSLGSGRFDVDYEAPLAPYPACGR